MPWRTFAFCAGHVTFPKHAESVSNECHRQVLLCRLFTEGNQGVNFIWGLIVGWLTAGPLAFVFFAMVVTGAQRDR